MARVKPRKPVDVEPPPTFKMSFNYRGWCVPHDWTLVGNVEAQLPSEFGMVDLWVYPTVLARRKKPDAVTVYRCSKGTGLGVFRSVNSSYKILPVYSDDDVVKALADPLYGLAVERAIKWGVV